MSWAKPRLGVRFRVIVYIVDDTYWDDGNRTTSRVHDFAELGEAYEFISTSRKSGWYETVSGVTREKLRRRLDPDSFCLYEWKRGWNRLKDDDILALLATL